MLVKPDAKNNNLATVALNATRVQIDHDQSRLDRLEINIIRPDGGTTTVVVWGSQGCTLFARIVGHTEDALPAEQPREGGGG